MTDTHDWDSVTWKGNRRRQHEAFLALSFREKLAVIENLGEIGEALRGARVRKRSALEDLVEDEVLEWYSMTPKQRWLETLRLWDTFLLLGGSLEPEPDSQSPFHDAAARSHDAADGRAGVHPLRRGGV
ncbi:MAG: hypothetical protein ACREMA_14510 [Longimicrobiales bacterium]